MHDAWEDELRQWLTERRAGHQFRRRPLSESAQQPIMRVDGRRLLAFCSNDYLGLANHPRVIEAVSGAARKWGVGAGASPFANGYGKAHQQLEEEFADFVSRPRALLFPSGHMASVGVLSALLTPGDHVLQDRHNHPALAEAGALSGARLSHYRHADPESLLGKLDDTGSGLELVVTDGVFAVDGDLAPLSRIAEICAANGAHLSVDDAHGFGVLGASGCGTCELQGVQPDLLTTTLGNALGVAGAVVAGSETLIETVLQRAPSYGDTAALPLPAALAEGARAALRLLETEAWRRETVWALTERFKSGARRLRLPLLESPTPIQPLLAGGSERACRLSDALARAGILVPAIRPPAVAEGQAKLRITLCASHTTGHVDSLLSALADVWEAEGEEPGP